MKKQITKTWNKPPVVLPITADELLAMGITEKDIEAGEKRGELKTYGPWQIPISYRALCVSSIYSASYYTKTERTMAYGVRTMTQPKESGYCLEGRVSIGGKKYSAFTTSQLFELPDGRLIDVAVIHARVR